MREAGLHPSPLLAGIDELLDRAPQLLARGLGWFVLHDAGAHAHHLVERPVRDPVAVREAPAPMPPDRLGEPVDVLEELPRQPRFSDPREADDGQQPRGVLLAGRVEKLLEQAQFAVTADEGRLEAGRAKRPAGRRHDTPRTPEPFGQRFPLELVQPGVLVHNCGLGRGAGAVADVDRSGFGGRLHAGSRVDEIARHHPLTAHPEVHRRLSGEQTGAGPEPRRAHLLAKRRYGIDQFESRPDRALGVVLAAGWDTPHSHHGVADELLDLAAVAGDDRARRIEVPAQEFANVFGVALLRELREADQVGEEHGDMAAFGEARGGLELRTGATTGLAIAGSDESAAPHSPQKRSPSLYAVPHDGQARDSIAPHWTQKRAPGRFSAPQAVQVIGARLLAAEWG